MIILQLAEPGLRVYPDADTAERAIDAPNIERSLQLAYDDSGYKLDVEWLEPNRTSGRYRFIRSSVREPLVLADLITAAPYFEPAEYTSEMLGLVDELRQRYLSC